MLQRFQHRPVARGVGDAIEPRLFPRQGGIQRAPQATGCWWIQIHVVPAVPLRRLRKQGILLSSSGCHQHDTQVELGRARHEVAGGVSGGCEEWSPDVRTPLPTFRLPIWFLHLHHRTRRCLASFWWVDHLNAFAQNDEEIGLWRTCGPRGERCCADPARP
jgi:hypothetical protein